MLSRLDVPLATPPSRRSILDQALLLRLLNALRYAR
jgi:hypothetical protein